MMDDRQFTDEDLTAFLDAEADADLSAAIGARRETDAALAARLEALDIPLVQIAGAYDAMLANAPAMPAFVNDTKSVPRRFGWGWGAGTFAGGLAAGLAVAAFLGLGAPTPAKPGWVAYVASYQALYTTQTLTLSAPPSHDETQAQLAAVSAALGLDITALPMAQGLTFKRAQVLGFNGKPLIQIAFLRDDGTPVALCIIPAGPDTEGMELDTAQGLDLARWNAPGFGYLLIGGDDAAPLAAEAETFRQWSVGQST
jgi:anti-sigma factor RsiW